MENLERGEFSREFQMVFLLIFYGFFRSTARVAAMVWQHLMVFSEFVGKGCRKEGEIEKEENLL